MLGSDEAPLDRFVLAQNDVWDQVMSEIVSGRKQTHWMWFVFPQLAVLGRSEKSRFYGIRNRREAQDYLADPILGARLRDAAETLLFSARGTAEEVLGGRGCVEAEILRHPLRGRQSRRDVVGHPHQVF